MRRDITMSQSRHCKHSARRNRRLIAGLLAVFTALDFTALALAAPKSIADCEAIQAPDAYNQCLASFGPTRGQRVKTYPGEASSGIRAGSGDRAVRRAPHLGERLSYGRHGRVRMEFTPRGR